MKIDINENSYAISIKKEQYDFLCENFKKYDIKYPKIIKGIKKDDLYPNCHSVYDCVNFSHIKCIYSAIKNNLPYCVIFEDDAYCICKNAHKKINDIVLDMESKKIDWDIILIGYCKMCPNEWILNTEYPYQKFYERVKKDIIHDYGKYCQIYSGCIGGAHAYIINKKYYSNFVKYCLDNSQYVVDMVLCRNKNAINIIIKKPIFIQCNISIKKYYLPYFINKYDTPISPLYIKNFKDIQETKNINFEYTY